jgi:hypothetical protein
MYKKEKKKKLEIFSVSWLKRIFQLEGIAEFLLFVFLNFYDQIFHLVLICRKCKIENVLYALSY